MKESIRQAAESEGYEVAHSQESYGEHSFALLILVKMSNRKLCDKDRLYRVGDQIKRDLDTVSAEMDPEGPAKRERERVGICGIYQSAGVDAIYMEPLANGYCSEPCCLNLPWFRVTSKIGHVVIGWRKRVLSIDWKDSLVKASGNELFPEENVTRWETGIHAWSTEDAAKYIRRLHVAPAAPGKDGR